MIRPSPARRTLLVLAASIAATVATSWLCAGWIPEPAAEPARDMGASLTGGPPAWGDPILAARGIRPGLTVTEEAWGLVLLEGEPGLLTFRRAGEVRRERRLDDFAPQENILVTRRRSEAGFPLPALRWTTTRTTADVDLPPSALPPEPALAAGLLGLDNVVFQTLQAQPDRALPIVPAWPGLAVNTLAAAALLWTAFIGVPALRRSRRTARGLCPACAYPLPAPAAVCPECGAPPAAA